MSRYISQGCIFGVKDFPSWMIGYASVPTLERISGDLVNIYFSTRDEQNRSAVGWFQIDLKNPSQIKKIASGPVLTYGKLGCFDDSGVTPTQILSINGETFLYYVGWAQSRTVRFQLHVGIAKKISQYEFVRTSDAPLLDRSIHDPTLTATLSILKIDNIYRMWYVSGDSWEMIDGETFPKYNIKYAESYDGFLWKREGLICIDYDGIEYAIARPSVIFDGMNYKMWFCAKGENYQIYEANSHDGINWIRKKKPIKFSGSTSKEDMLCYPAAIVDDNGRTHLFYNGSNYGEKGVHYAYSDE